MKNRIKNKPPIREIIRQLLADRAEPTDVREIYDYVAERVTLVSDTPRSSVFSVLTRMPDVIRVEPRKYALTPSVKDPQLVTGRKA